MGQHSTSVTPPTDHGDTDQRYLCVFYTHSGLVPRSVPLSFDVPVVVGLGEGDDQKIPVLQVFYICDMLIPIINKSV